MMLQYDINEFRERDYNLKYLVIKMPVSVGLISELNCRVFFRMV